MEPPLIIWGVLSAPVPLRLRPMEIGDVLDEIFRTYRRNFLALAGVSVGLSLPLAALAGYSFGALFSNLITQAGSGNPVDVGSSLFGLALGYLAYLVLTPLQIGAITYAICESALGRPVLIGAMLRAAFRRYLHVLGYVVLLVLMVISFCLFPLWTWIVVGWVALLPAIFIENLGLVQAMGRSWRLVRGMWWRTFFILFLVLIIEYVVTLALGGFLYLGQSLLAIVLPPYLTLSIYEGADIIVQALALPILLIAVVLLYFDLRVRKEGIDLFQLAGRLTASSNAPA